MESESTEKFNPYFVNGYYGNSLAIHSPSNPKEDGEEEKDSDEESDLGNEPEREAERILRLPKLSSASSAKIAEIYESYDKEKDSKKLITVIPHKLYLNALITLKQLDKALTTSNNLSSILRGYDFCVILKLLTEKCILPMISRAQ